MPKEPEDHEFSGAPIAIDPELDRTVAELEQSWLKSPTPDRTSYGEFLADTAGQSSPKRERDDFER